MGGFQQQPEKFASKVPQNELLILGQKNEHQ
jgi:hypothetical protein